MLKTSGIVLSLLLPSLWLGYVIGTVIERRRTRMMKARIELLGEVFRNEPRPLDQVVKEEDALAPVSQWMPDKWRM